MLRAPVALTVAGRTDRGVHALGQVVSYDGRRCRAALASTRCCRDEIAVLAAEEAPDGFTARHDARQPHLPATACCAPRAPSPFERGRALWWPHRARLEALQACAALLAGTHDFTAFTPTETYHQRFERDVLGAELGRAPATCSSSGSRPTRSCAT